MDKIKAFIKYILSFRKSTWTIDDYPLRYRYQHSKIEINRLKLPHWCVQIINWWVMTGMGSTKQEAYKDLKYTLNKRIQEGKILPRPGTGLPLEYASTEIIDQNIKLLDDFLNKILGLKNKDSVFISDESSLWDFSMSENGDNYNEKIKQIYGVDVSDIEDRKISKIINRIKDNKNKVLEY